MRTTTVKFSRKKFYFTFWMALSRPKIISLLIYSIVIINTNWLSAFDISQLKFDVFDIKKGLSQNSVYKIYQDSKGYMWLCTGDGINRFDGYNFLEFDKQLGNKNSLVSNYTTCIVESSPGIFWIGTEKGFSVFFYETKKFINFDNPTLIRKIVKEDSLSVIIQTAYSLYKARIVEIKKDNYTIQLDPFNAYKEVLCKPDSNHIYLSGRDGKLYNYDIRTKLVQTNKSTDIWSLLIPKRISEIVVDSNAIYWVGTSNGLYKLSEHNNLIDSFKYQRLKYPGLIDKITGITKDKQNNIYIATYQHGLVIYDKIHHQFFEYENDPYNLSSIPDNKLTSIYIDRSGTLWIGTKGAGISNFSPYKFKFKHINQEPFKNSWLSNKYILCFEEGQNNNIWIGTDGGGVYKYNPEKNIFSNWRNNTAPNSLSNDVVQSLLIDAKKQLWIGTLNGVCKYNPNTNNFTRYTLSNNRIYANLKIPSYNTIRLFENSKNELFVFADHVIYKYNSSLNAFKKTAFNFTPNSIVIRSILEDTDESWWLGTSIGLLHVTENGQFLDEKVINAINKNNFNTDQLFCLSKEDANNFWIGTGSSGLYFFNISTKNIQAHYTEKDGLCNNFIYGILKDNKDKIWISTNKGISVFDAIEKTFRNFDINDGLQSNEFNSGAYFKSHNNLLYFGGNNGYNIIELDNIPYNTTTPTTNIINIKSDNNTYNLQQYTNQTKKQVIDNYQNNISFEFASSDYSNTPKNKFEYKLEGYDKNWSSSNGRNFVAYNRLPPGKYTFYVRASNNDGVWSKAPASFYFKIKPRIWQTWWFKSILAILILIYLYQFIYDKIQSVRKKDKEQSELARQKTEYEKQLAEIKLKALLAQMNPHFIFNCMNSIQAMILSDQNMQASLYLTKLSRLVRSVLENSIKTFIPLQEVIDNLKLYLELESIRFDRQFNYTIEAENIDTYSIEIPSMLLQPYVENAIWHGLLKKEGEKNIHLKFYVKDKKLFCEIEDDGIGRTKAASLNLIKQHKSLGTSITHEMFETLHKIKETDYSVETIDLYDKDNVPCGTKVIINIGLN